MYKYTKKILSAGQKVLNAHNHKKRENVTKNLPQGRKNVIARKVFLFLMMVSEFFEYYCSPAFLP